MKIAFRVDASFEIGTGHVMRCLTLADELWSRGITIIYICRELPGNLCNLIEAKGYRVFRLPYAECSISTVHENNQYRKWLGVSLETDSEETKKVLSRENVDWLIVDSYALDYHWEIKMRSCVAKIMIIDDLADRKHDCEILLDQNFYNDYLCRYDALVSRRCLKLLGPKFALLRPEFYNMREEVEIRRNIKRLFIFFGGSDFTNETYKVLKAIELLQRPDISVDVVLGKNNVYKNEIQLQTSKMSQVKVYCNVNNMAELMVNADLCIGAAGGTTWERCCLGLPAVVLTVAENQVQTTSDLAECGVLDYLGRCTTVTAEMIFNKLSKILLHPSLLRQYSVASLKLVDGCGVNRCVDKIMGR